MGKRIEFDHEARNSLSRGVDQLAGAVRVTLGPRGRNVVIDRLHSAPTITSDGLAIAREIELENRFENLGAQLVREVALKTGEVAGDGTTTATVLAHGIVTRGLQAVAAGHNPMRLKRGIDLAVSAAVEDLRRQARAVDGRADLERVAGISANDPRIGAVVAEAFDRVGRAGVVTVDEGRGLTDTLDIVEGIRLDYGYVSPYFVTRGDDMVVTLEHPFVLVTSLRLTAAQEVLGILEHAAQAGRPLVVIAEEIEAEALATLVINRLRGTLACVGVRVPQSGATGRELIEDIGLLTGATVVTRELGRSLNRLLPEDLGRAQRVIVERDTTTIVAGGGDPRMVRDRITSFERAVMAAGTGFERDGLRQRLARLSGGIAVVRVGAPTELEMAERRARFDDALAATRSAVEEGMVPGGGVALLRTASVLESLGLSGDEQMGVAIVASALEQPARQIAENAGERGGVVIERIRAGQGAFGYDALQNRYCDLDQAGIVDPAKVARCALQNAASIGTLVLTTDAIVVDEDEEAPPPE